MKKIFLMIGILVVLLLVLAKIYVNATNDEKVMLGDVTGDGLIQTDDAKQILEIYARVQTGGSSYTEKELKTGDIDKNGTINALDASELLTFITTEALNETGELTLEKFIEER